MTVVVVLLVVAVLVVVAVVVVVMVALLLLLLLLLTIAPIPAMRARQGTKLPWPSRPRPKIKSSELHIQARRSAHKPSPAAKRQTKIKSSDLFRTVGLHPKLEESNRGRSHAQPRNDKQK